MNIMTTKMIATAPSASPEFVALLPFSVKKPGAASATMIWTSTKPRWQVAPKVKAAVNRAPNVGC